MSSFSRITVVEAVSLIEDWGHSRIDQFSIRYGLKGVFPSKDYVNKQDKTNAVAEYLLNNPHKIGPNGSKLTFEVIEYLVSELSTKEEDIFSFSGHGEDPFEDLRFHLAQDGYSIRDGSLVGILPEEIDLPQRESELEKLLRQFGFNIALSHF